MKGRPRCVQVMRWQREVRELHGLVDSDHAGCLRTRRSTSSCMIMRGGHLIRSSSTTQKQQGLSSAESEFLAIVKGSSLILGATNMARDLGRWFEAPQVESDSSAGKAVANRKGVGQIRHLHTPLLWVQWRVADGTLRVVWRSSEVQWADLATKHVPEAMMLRCLEELGFRFEEGKSNLALKAAR